MNVLIIDDDKLTLNSLKFSIEGLGHTATTAENAEKAMSEIVEGKFDLVLSDIMMPGISGLSLLNILRNEHSCHTPIIAMSTLNNRDLLDAAFQAGTNDFMIKPFSLIDLEEKLKKFDKNETVTVSK